MVPQFIEALQSAATLPRIGEIVRRSARQVAGADGATFVLREGDLCFYADEDAIAPLWKGQRFPMTECISGWAMINKQTVTVPDIEQDDRIPLAAYRPTFVRSLIMTPINREQPVGAIGAYWADAGAPEPAGARALEAVAAAAAAAIERVGVAEAPWAPNFGVPGASVRRSPDPPATPREGARATSAGLLLYRRVPGLEVLLGHMGGPYFARRDDGAWSIPKGEYGPEEEPLAAARREFAEELGSPPPAAAEYRPLGQIRQRNGKQVTAWAVEADFDVSTLVSNTFEIEWPPRSGRRRAFPEIDRADWFELETARRKMVAGQAALLDRLLDALR